MFMISFIELLTRDITLERAAFTSLNIFVYYIERTDMALSRTPRHRVMI